MINVVQNGKIYEISFQYDRNIVDLVKNVPGRQYIPSAKIWTIPSNHLGMLINEFKGTIYEPQLYIVSDEDINVNSSLDSTSNIPDVDLTGVNFYIKEGSYPYKHQWDFMKYGIVNDGKGFIVGDEMRMGKTIEVVNLALHRRKTHNYKRCLIICCVNTSKYNWEEDILTHLHGEETPYILGTRLKRNGEVRYDTGSKEKLEDLKTGHMYGKEDQPELPYFIITNIESLRNKKGKSYPIAEELINMANSGELDMIAIDEVHKNTSPSSIQGKVLLKIKKMTGDRIEWLPMTGTPIVNKPTDCYLPLKLVDGHSFKDYWSWCHYFCVYAGYGGHDIVAYKHIPELKDMLQSHMIRRLKKDVYDMPPKIRYTEYVENTPTQSKLYEEIKNQIRQERDMIISSMNPLSSFLRLRQVNGSPELVDDTIEVNKDYPKKNAKLVRLMDILEEVHSRGEKVIIFSNWVSPLRTLYRFVATKYNTCCFTGTMKEEVRQKHKRVFINNPNYTVMMGTISALGTTHTLTVADNIIFYDEPWTPTDRIQAEDRAYGLQSTRPLNIYTIISKDTVDDVVHNILKDKEDISNYIVDGKLDIRSNPKLFDILLGDTKYF